MFQTDTSYLRVNTPHIHHKDQWVDKIQGSNSCVFLNTNKSADICYSTRHTYSYSWYEVRGSCIPHLGLWVHMVLSKGSTTTQSPSNSKIGWSYFNLYTVTALQRCHKSLALTVGPGPTIRPLHLHKVVKPVCRWHAGITGGYLHLCASHLETYWPSLPHFIRTKTMNFYTMYAINILQQLQTSSYWKQCLWEVAEVASWRKLLGHGGPQRDPKAPLCGACIFAVA